MTISLRPYQIEALEAVQNAYEQGTRKQLVHIATGGGKTIIFATLIAKLNWRTLVLAHTTELLDQAREKIQMISPGLNVGIVKAGLKEYESHVVVCSIQSARQPETLIQLQKQDFALCIYDECHRACTKSARDILQALGFLDSSDKLLCGYSATPFRNDTKGLGEVFERVVYKKTIKELISLGYLCPPKGIKIRTDLDLATIKTEDGDFVSEALANYMNTPEMNEVVVNSYLENAQGRKAVCFAVTVSHAKNLTTAFRKYGVVSEAIYGDMPADERANVLKRFQKGEISVLTNCQILTEGWDCQEVDCIIVAKPTQSKGLYQQMCGRGLRLYPNKKDCLILDFGSKTHSLCGSAILDRDSESDEPEQKQSSVGRMIEFAKTLPPTINRKLRASIIEFDPLGDDFTWIKDRDTFYLRAIEDKILKIFPTSENRFSVIFFNVNSHQTIAKDISFEYAFSTAEEFAKANRSLFTISDLEAHWRTLPISDKQKDLFRSYGYRSGIEDLSRGQAALIISSGVLSKKAVRG